MFYTPVQIQEASSTFSFCKRKKVSGILTEMLLIVCDLWKFDLMVVRLYIHEHSMYPYLFIFWNVYQKF